MGANLLMKIVHVIESMRRDRGGPVTVVSELARAQALAGARVSVAHRISASTVSDLAALAHRWQGLGIEQLDTGSPNWRDAALDAAVGPTVLHLHGVWDRDICAAAKAGDRSGTPWVVSTHGMLHPYAMAQKRLKKMAYLMLYGDILQRADALFVLNEAERLQAAARFGTRAVLVPNGVDPAQFDCSDQGAALRKLVPQIGDRPYLLFLGRLHPIKGIDALVRSYAMARGQGLDAELVLAGPDDGALASALSTAEHLRVRSHIHAPGQLDGALRLSAYSGCALFVHRPVYEGFGLAIAEALAAARPALTTARCELDGSGAGTFLIRAPDDDREFAIAMSRAYAAERPMRRREDAVQWVNSRFSWAAIAQLLAREYEFALNAGPGRYTAPN
jgi:glycosyltransferase involved in cell wall biosynthesis